MILFFFNTDLIVSKKRLFIKMLLLEKIFFKIWYKNKYLKIYDTYCQLDIVSSRHDLNIGLRNRVLKTRF